MSNKEDVQVLITVPHGDCNKDSLTNRKCDRVAFTVASMIRTSLEEIGILPYFYSNTDIPRQEMDMNRKSSRGSHFRQSITEVLKYMASVDKLAYVFDIHSFPQRGKFPIYFIIHNTREIVDQATSLGSILTIEMGFKIGIYIINSECDIITQAHDHAPGAFPFLIEINEDVTNGVITRLGKNIAKWVALKTREAPPELVAENVANTEPEQVAVKAKEITIDDETLARVEQEGAW